MSGDASSSLDIDRDRLPPFDDFAGRGTPFDRVGPAWRDLDAPRLDVAADDQRDDEDRWKPLCGEFRKSIRLGRWIAPPPYST